MNGHERRRRGRVGAGVEMRFGRCVMEGDAKLVCFACGEEAKDWSWADGPALLGYGLAEIEEGKRSEQVPICERCYYSESSTSDAIMRKWWNTPDLKITKGGEATTEHDVEAIASALSEKNDATAH